MQVQKEAGAALRETGSDAMDLAADDLLPLLTYVIGSSRAFRRKPYTRLQLIRELAYDVRYSVFLVLVLVVLVVLVHVMTVFRQSCRYELLCVFSSPVLNR